MKSFVRAAFRSVGLEIKRVVPAKPPAEEPSYSTLEEFLLQLQRVGFSPHEIYDIGATDEGEARDDGADMRSQAGEIALP